MKDEKLSLMPRLRFPEFRDAGDWIKIKLRDLGKLIPGLTYSPEDVKEEGLLVLRSSNVQDGNIVLNDNVFVRSDIKGANLSKPGDILICVRNGSKPLIGKNALIPEGLPSCTHGAFMTAFRSKNPEFVYQLFQTAFYKKQVAADLGATINSINGKNLKRYEFFIPRSEGERQKIADCLSSLDALIAAQADKIHALKTHRNGLMQQLFPREGETVPRLRFPEFRNAGNWEKLPLGDIVGFMSGGTPSKDRAEYWGGDIPWVSAASMHEISIDRSDRNITQSAVDDGARIIPKGTLLILVRGSMLHKRIPIGITACEVAFNQDVKALRMKSELSEEFILHLLISSEARLLCAVSGTGIGAGKLDTSELEEFLICVPEMKEEQQRVANCLSSLDAMIAAHTEKLDFLKTHKRGLMQQLFPSPGVAGV